MLVELILDAICDDVGDKLRRGPAPLVRVGAPTVFEDANETRRPAAGSSAEPTGDEESR